MTYPDAPEPELVHPPEDYTTNLEVRVKGSTLYVYRTVILLWTEYRLAVYDLANRRPMVDLLVAPEDMPARPEARYGERQRPPVAVGQKGEHGGEQDLARP